MATTTASRPDTPPTRAGERSQRPHRKARPHQGLRGLVARDYWGVIQPCRRHRLSIPATASVPLVLKICDSPYRPPAFLHGVHDHFVLMDGECAPSYLEILMAPLGAYRLLGRPVRELGDGVVDLESVFGAAGRRLLEAVRERTSWRGRFAAVDAFLLAAAESGPVPAPEVRHAWHLITASGGRAPIGRVATEIGWSHKHLITKFSEQVGLAPKAVARLTRFERALAHANRRPDLAWSHVAADAGYADQPHLIRDFRVFTGATPGDPSAA
jgi:AraC-like DNA-binding protein